MTPSEQIKDLFKKLSTDQQNQLLKDLPSLRNKTLTNIEDSIIVECPYCKQTDIFKNGKHKGSQRYKCKSCNRNFKAATGRAFYGIKKKVKFAEYKSIMIKEGLLPLKQMSSRLGISIQTAFDWRHKILSSINTGTQNFDGITEIDDIWFLYSQKGRQGLEYSRKRGGSKRKGDNDFQVKMLVTMDRKQSTDLSVVRIGRLKSSDIKRKVGEKVSKTATLVSDKHSSISAFAKRNNIEHINFKASEHIADSQHHVQTVNNLASRIKGKLNHSLRGVSTKYLQNYSNWFQFYESNKNSDDIVAEADKILSKNYDAWNVFTNIENFYKRFIKEYSKRTYRCPTKRTWENQLKDTMTLANLFIY